MSVFYAAAALLALALGLCAHVARDFRKGSFSQVWPIIVLRGFVSVFFSTFAVSALQLYLVVLLCSGHGQHAGYLVLYPSVQCWGFPNLLHSCVGLLCILVFTAVAFLVNVCEATQNMLDEHTSACADSRFLLAFTSVQIAANVATTLLQNSNHRLLAVLLLLCFFACAYIFARRTPFYSASFNLAQAFLNGCLCWAGVCVVILALSPFGAATSTRVLAFGTFPFALLTTCVAYATLWNAQRVGDRFLFVAREMAARDRKTSPQQVADVVQAAFSDPWHCERCSRIVRELIGQKLRDPTVLLATEAILVAGLEQFPSSCWLHVLAGSFVIDVAGDPERGGALLERAKALRPSFRERFFIFTRSQEQKQHAQTESTGKKMDLVSYVEHATTVDLLLGMHRRTLQLNRTFWRLLQKKSGAGFGELSRAFREMDAQARAAP